MWWDEWAGGFEGGDKNNKIRIQRKDQRKRGEENKRKFEIKSVWFLISYFQKKFFHSRRLHEENVSSLF